MDDVSISFSLNIGIGIGADTIELNYDCSILLFFVMYKNLVFILVWLWLLVDNRWLGLFGLVTVID